MSEWIDTRERLITKLDDLEKQRSDLFQHLKGSLALQELWPEVFEHGSVITRIAGSHSNGFKFYIQQSGATGGLNEHIKEFELSEIPLELACREHIKSALKSIVNERCGPSDAKKQAEELLQKLWKRGL
jgi:hypothetical protein